jgi:mRNA (guanine-N7-)-methyltransferase
MSSIKKTKVNKTNMNETNLNTLSKEPLEEVFEEDVEIEYIKQEATKKMNEKNEKGDNKSIYVQKQQASFEQLIRNYYESNPFDTSNKTAELEVRFGTRGIKNLNKNDYDNVIKKLKSSNFTSLNENGEYSLRMQNEFLDSNTGKFRVSNIRTEIYGLTQIQEYCINNNLSEIIKNSFASVRFTKKNAAFNDKKERILPVNFDDFNFRVSFQTEEVTYSGRSNTYIVDNWQKSKKTFRYLNRVTFKNPDYPVNVDISIVKDSEREGYDYKKYYTTEEAGIFSRPERYEIELEVINKEIGPGTKFNSPQIILECLRKVIKTVLSGLQGTNFPISYTEQKSILEKYMELLHKNDFNRNRPIYPSNFIGPSSKTLQTQNIAVVDENSIIPNIRVNYTVTDKADGDRCLLYISETGKIYLINTNMNVIFTGAKTFSKETYDTLIDGELILHDKNGTFINLFAAFDIYYVNKIDVRSYSFMPYKKETDIDKFRYYLLKKIVLFLKPVSILETEKSMKEKDKNMKSVLERYASKEKFLSPINIQCKQFYPENPEIDDIFVACNSIMTKVANNLFEYNTDGLIFTPAYMGVGADVVGKAGPLSKMTWDYSFKWKPPKYNTIDFLVTTVKSTNGDDEIKPIYEEGLNVLNNNQISEYKMIQLRCTFIEKIHGYVNPCQDVIDDIITEYVNFEDKNTNEAKPVQFYPTNPYDPTAGLCKIMLKLDDNNVMQMFTEEDEVFTDNTIVEFSYDLTREKGWRWIPLRVRYDKTSEFRQGYKNFGNAYHVANSNWMSIHNPVTEDMICSGLNIPKVNVDEDVYYNRVSGASKTQALRDFHNLYVKKMLIKNVSKKGDSLIDYACGKAGDLPKWISANLSFVFGIDISKDNLENRLDGACARYLNYCKSNKNMPGALFVNGNSSYNIKNGSAMLNDKAKQITKAVFGIGKKDERELGKGVYKQFGKAEEGFNISSCQFALHYFFESPETFQGFMVNLADCTKLGGYFIGSAYDGKLLFSLLKNKQPGESVQIVDDNVKIWEIVKEYNSLTLDDNASCLGYKIDVYQETINQLIPEYLINFDYLNRIMEDYGFKIIDRNEASNLHLPEGSGLFSELYLNMQEEIQKNKFKKNEYGTAPQMNAFEKKISFLNRYFIYKKIRNVNAEKVEIDLGDYDFSNASSKLETKMAIEVAKSEVKKLTPKIKKLNKKLLLVPATEAKEVSIQPIVNTNLKETEFVYESKPEPEPVIEINKKTEKKGKIEKKAKIEKPEKSGKLENPEKKEKKEKKEIVKNEKTTIKKKLLLIESDDDDN